MSKVVDTDLALQALALAQQAKRRDVMFGLSDTVLFRRGYTVYGIGYGVWYLRDTVTPFCTTI